MLDQISSRRTYKVIGDTERPQVNTSLLPADIDTLISAAGNAPFHYACDRIHQTTLNSPVPWRCYKLASEQCNALMRNFLDGGDQTKVPNMLAAAEYLIQVTWLPDEGTKNTSNDNDKTTPLFSGTMRNMEHIA
ncbi:MAG: hypothetical protein AAF412_13905, partial [Pseudomonadota bacterium]